MADQTTGPSIPKPGEQYVFEVDLNTCTGCKGCVTACHNLNGLKPEESWRSVGVMESISGKLSQSITTSCHHCLDPACLSGCPTIAYVKDPLTGVVRHLDDQCIGCQYCILRCPYEAPKWIPSLGIVRKCDMCTERLEIGEETACQQGCPNGAISIGVRDKRDIAIQGGWPVPVAAPWEYTSPTTQYLGLSAGTKTRELEEHYEPEKAHLPLVLMLILTQFSVGLWGISFFLEEMKLLQTISVVTALSGLVSSTFHLGHPEKAYRAFLGFRTSWLSREVVFFGLYAPMAAGCVGADWLIGNGWVEPSYLTGLLVGQWVAFGFGMFGVFASAKLYQTTPRPLWKGSKALLGFPMTALILGSAFAYSYSPLESHQWLLWVLMASSQSWLLLEIRRNHRPKGLSPQLRSLLQGPLKGEWNLQRYGLFVFGLVVPCLLLGYPDSAPVSSLMFYGLLAACVFERHLFFKLGIGPRMPKGEAG